jgi:murein DD-endopeptidase MepM/ murein hydrolase activator NlpD
MGRLVLAVLLCASLIPGHPARAAEPSIEPQDTDVPASLACVTPLAIPLVRNVMETKWSPDSTKLAIVWFAKLPSPRSNTGYREQEVTDTLDLRTGRLWPVGVGDQPRWSATGKFLSYWGPTLDDLRVVGEDRLVASLFPTVPEVRWVGDGLVFIEKNEIREWREGAVRTVSTLSEEFVPKYPADDVHWSADGRRFTLTRYSLNNTVEWFIGDTLTAELLPLHLEGARYTEWAPLGDTLLVRYLDRIELRDFAANAVRTLPLTALAGPVHQWAPDGQSLLVGKVTPTVPAGNAYDAFRPWDDRGGAPATLPNLLGERKFSPDGRYFVGVTRTGVDTTQLSLYACKGLAERATTDGTAPSRLDAIEGAKGRLVRPVAGEITQFLQGGHTGIDLAAPVGSLITADDDGVVTSTSWVAVGGNRVCVQHVGGLESCFYHTSAPLVSVGERVARGQPVALIGMTGLTTGPHTHWETKLFGRIVSPLDR